MQVHGAEIGSIRLGSLFLTLPTRVLIGQHVISSGANETRRKAAECLIRGRLPRWATHPVFIGFVFTHISAAVCVTIPTLALKMISRVRCVQPNDGIRRAMLLRHLLALKHHHPATERRADDQERTPNIGINLKAIRRFIIFLSSCGSLAQTGLLTKAGAATHGASIAAPGSRAKRPTFDVALTNV